MKNKNKFYKKYNKFDTGGIADIVSMGLSQVANGINNAQIADTTNLKKAIVNGNNTTIATNSNDALMDTWANTSMMSNVSASDLKSGNFGTDLLQAVGAAGSGAIGGGAVGAGIGGVASLVGSFAGRLNAAREAATLNQQIKVANNRKIDSLAMAAGNISKQNNYNIASNYFADGGSLQHGGGHSNGMVSIDAGGTHEQNPNQGVQMGVDPQGIPNLVEEGEKKFGNYIFSDRLVVDEELIEYFGLPSNFKGKTFAQAAEIANKESEERPYDPISKRGLEKAMKQLQEAQEVVRQFEAEQEQAEQQAMMEEQMMAQGVDPDMLRQAQQQQAMQQQAQMQQPQINETAMLQQQMAGQERNMFDGGSYISTIKDLMYRPNNIRARHDRQYYNTLANTPSNTYNVLEKVIVDDTKPPKYSLAMDDVYTQSQGDFETPFRSFRVPELYHPNDPRERHDNRYDEDDYPIQTIDMSKRTNNNDNNGIIEVPLGDDLGTPITGLIGSTDTGEGTDIGENTNTTPNKRRLHQTYSRYAPIIAAGLASLTDTLGLTNKPDYTDANMIGAAVDAIPNVDYNPIGNYLSYNPLDRNYHTNRMTAQANATRRALINQSAGNRATAAANILAADYNAQERLGQMAYQAEAQNRAHRQQVENFNRGTNQMNSQMALQAAGMNQSAAAQRLSGRQAQAQMRMQERAMSDAARAANLDNFVGGLGDIGRENMAFNMINMDSSNYYYYDDNNKLVYGEDYKNADKITKMFIDAKIKREQRQKKKQQEQKKKQDK